MPLPWCEPANTQEVADVVRLCAAEKVSVVPQGAIPPWSAAASRRRRAARSSLSLNRMTRITDIDPIGYTMTVEAGVFLKTIQETGQPRTTAFPLSLAAEGSCSIGGNLSTNAGGVPGAALRQRPPARARPRSGDAPGRDLERAARSQEDNTGYDLRDLYLGAEGTLGIITRAVLKLWPKPKDVATAWVAVPSPRAAVALLSARMPPQRIKSRPAS